MLTGDVHGFGGLMRAGADAPVRQALEEAVRKWAREAMAAEASAGDAVLGRPRRSGRRSPRSPATSIDEVYRAPASLGCGSRCTTARCRRAGRPATARSVIAGGDAVLCAARVEPHVEPGQIWATEEFRAQLARAPSLWRTTPVPGPDGDERRQRQERRHRAGPLGAPVSPRILMPSGHRDAEAV